MHDIDSTARELADELLGTSNEMDEFEFDEIGGSDSETELASQLLEISDEGELDQFLGKLVKSAGRLLKSPAGRMLSGALKGVVKKALPMAGSALGNMVVPGLGGALGGQLAGALGSSVGLEAEALGTDELQMEVAKGVVRTASQAARQVARDPRATTAPRSAVKDAIAGAVANHLPGLIKPAAQVLRHRGCSTCGVSGQWVRRGDRIILFGI